MLSGARTEGPSRPAGTTRVVPISEYEQSSRELRVIISGDVARGQAWVIDWLDGKVEVSRYNFTEVVHQPQIFSSVLYQHLSVVANNLSMMSERLSDDAVAGIAHHVVTLAAEELHPSFAGTPKGMILKMVAKALGGIVQRGHRSPAISRVIDEIYGVASKNGLLDFLPERPKSGRRIRRSGTARYYESSWQGVGAVDPNSSDSLASTRETLGRTATRWFGGADGVGGLEPYYLRRGPYGNSPAYTANGRALEAIRRLISTDSRFESFIKKLELGQFTEKDANSLTRIGEIAKTNRPLAMGLLNVALSVLSPRLTELPVSFDSLLHRLDMGFDPRSPEMTTDPENTTEDAFFETLLVLLNRGETKLASGAFIVASYSFMHPNDVAEFMETFIALGNNPIDDLKRKVIDTVLRITSGIPTVAKSDILRLANRYLQSSLYGTLIGRHTADLIYVLGNYFAGPVAESQPVADRMTALLDKFIPLATRYFAPISRSSARAVPLPYTDERLEEIFGKFSEELKTLPPGTYFIQTGRREFEAVYVEDALAAGQRVTSSGTARTGTRRRREAGGDESAPGRIRDAELEKSPTRPGGIRDWEAIGRARANMSTEDWLASQGMDNVGRTGRRRTRGGGGGSPSPSGSARYYEFPGSEYMTMADGPASLDAFRAGIDAVGLVGGAFSSISRPFYRSTPSTVAGLMSDVETGETSGGAFEAGAEHLAGASQAGSSQHRVGQHVAGARVMTQTRTPVRTPVAALAAVRTQVLVP